MTSAILLTIYLVGLALALTGVCVSLGWTFGTRHDDGALLIGCVACFAWPLIVVIVLFEAWSDRVERKRNEERWGI